MADLVKTSVLLSQAHLLDSTISFKNPLQNTARNALEKRLTEDRNKTLAGSIFGRQRSQKVSQKAPN